MSEYIIGMIAEVIERVKNGETIRITPKLTEIVRCRDCTGMVETWDGYECERFSGEYHRAEPDGFCAWGERKNDERA